MKKRIFKLDFDGNVAIGSIGQTVTSTLGSRIKFCRFRKAAYEDTRGNDVDVLNFTIDGGIWDTAENNRFYQGQIRNGFEIVESV